MAKDRKKLQHIHSSIPDKQPTAASLEVAEIAVNNAADKEFLSIKNTNDKVVRFSSDGQIIEWIERKEVMPYVGYVRGAAGPSATSGDTPTADGYGSYGIENTDLLNNKSELVFKLNQVAADLTTKHDKVNGKKDMYNKDVNPTTDGGINDGAGFFIDMSRYAMQDANPQFSSTTNTCRTTLSGTTIIRGLDGSCGSLLDIKVNSAKTVINTANTSATTATLSGNTLQIRESGYIDYSGNTLTSYTTNKTCIQANTDLNMGGNTNTRIGYNCNGNSGYTNNTYISASSSAITYAPNIQISGNTTEITGTSNVYVYGNDVCISGVTDASLGAKTVKIGTDCGTNTIATGVTINATTSVTINAPTTIITGDTYISGETTINKELHLIKGLNKPLNWVYDDVCIQNHDSGTTVFAENSTDASRTITIPSSAAHIKRETLSWTYGSVTNASGSSYDPGSNSSSSCTQNSDSSKFIIPKTISDVTDGTVTLDTCLNVDTDICVTGKVSARDGFFQTSDRNAKKNIEKPNYKKFAGANSTPIVKFNYKDDETNRDVYGVIAQEAEANGLDEVVYTDENGKKSVDYTSLMILKIGYLENANAILRQQLGELYERVKNLEANK